MNRKAISLACVISLSVALIAGCGTNGADGRDVTGTNALQTRNNSTASNGGYGTPGYRTKGFGAGATDYDATGRGMIGLGTDTGEAARNGNTRNRDGQSTGLAAKGTNNTSGKMGILSAIQDENILVLDDTVILSGDQAGAKDTNRYGPDVTILQVTNQEAMQAMKRVKEKIGGNKGNMDIKGIAADLSLILQHAKPMK